jgi:hypothetical protein
VVKFAICFTVEVAKFLLCCGLRDWPFSRLTIMAALQAAAAAVCRGLGLSEKQESAASFVAILAAGH